MKKFFSAFFIVAAVATAFSCSKIEPVAGEVHTVTFNAISPATKTTFGTLSAGHFPTYWTTNDSQVKVAQNFSDGIDAAVTRNSDTDASFSATFTDDGSGDYTFYAISPASAVVSGVSPSNKSWLLEIPTTQTTTATGPDESAMILAAKSSTTGSFPDNVDLYFRHISAYVNMNITNLDLAVGDDVASVLVTADANIAYRYNYYVSGAKAGTLEASSGQNAITVITDHADNIWFACAPVASGTQLTIAVTTTESKVYSKVVNTPADLAAGHVASFDVNFSGITPTVTYTKVTGTLTSGWYVFGVVEGTTVHAIDNTVGTSWIKYTDVTATADVITNPADAVVWYYDATAGTIKSIDETNYIYWPGGGNSGGCGASSYAHTITHEGSGIYTVKSEAAPSRILRKNGTSGYRYYTSDTGSKEICFFKRDTGSSIPEATATVVTGEADAVSSAGATLHGSFSGATGEIAEAGFEYATSAGALDGTATFVYDYSCIGDVASGSISYALTSLAESTTYYYRAFVSEYNETTGLYEYRYGPVRSFTTLGPGGAPAAPGWLELPAVTGSEDWFGWFYGSGSSVGTNRNYSYNYSYTWYASLWVAYPLCGTHKSGSASSSSWKYNPDFAENLQVNIVSNSYGTMYNAGSYSRGHQCPSGSRKSDGTMNKQTYYATNQTPQLQNGFNGSIWSSLENAVRGLVSSASDTVYVVTGPAYNKVGESESITYLHGAVSGANPTELAVPNYYWKALLKVKRSGGEITSASAIGFWFDHKNYDDSNYAACAVSVDQIEEYTGFDLFTNLPAALQTTAEANTSWTNFQNF